MREGSFAYYTMTLLLLWTQRHRQQCCRIYHSMTATRTFHGLPNDRFTRKFSPLRHDGSHKKVQEFSSPWHISSCSFSTRLFVGGLSAHTDEEGLKRAFAAHGDVVEVKVVTDRETGRPKGFGFVSFASDVEADTAIAQMSGTILNGRTIRVDRAASRPPLPSTRSSTVSNGAGFGSGTSDSSSLPPVADDWGNIPTSFARIQQPVCVSSSSTPSPSPLSFGTSESSSSATATTSESSLSFSSSTTTSVHFGSSTPTTSSSSMSGSSSFNSSGSSCSTNAFHLSRSNTGINSPTNDATSYYVSSKPSYNHTVGGTLNSLDNSNFCTFGSTTSSISASVNSNIATTNTLYSTGSSSLSSTNNSSSLPASPFLTSDGKFDFSNFSLDNISHRDNDPPLPKRRPRPRSKPVTQTSSVSNINFYAAPTTTPFGSNNEYAHSTIPRPKGPEYNFGLLDIKAKPKFGAKPQGGYYVEIPDDLPEAPPVQETDPKPKDSGFLMFPQRMLPPLELPWDTPEADNWSEIGEDPPKYDLTTLFPSMEPIVKKDKEFHWDPYEFDEEAKLPEEKTVCDDSDVE